MAATMSDPPVAGLLLIMVFQLGICLLLLATVADAAQGYDTAVGSLGRVAGALTAGGALVTVVLRRRLQAT